MGSVQMDRMVAVVARVSTRRGGRRSGVAAAAWWQWPGVCTRCSKGGHARSTKRREGLHLKGAEKGCARGEGVAFGVVFGDGGGAGDGGEVAEIKLPFDTTRPADAPTCRGCARTSRTSGLKEALARLTQRDAYDVTEPRAASAGLADSLEATDEWLGTDDDVVAEALRFAPPRS
jgi:hypothetical protein